MATREQMIAHLQTPAGGGLEAEKGTGKSLKPRG